MPLILLLIYMILLEDVASMTTGSGSEPPATVECPKCGAMVPKPGKCLPWCECGWNLAPPETAPRTYFERLYEKIGKRRGRALFESLLSAPRAASSLTPSRLILNLLSLAIAPAFLFPIAAAAALLVFVPFNLFTFFYIVPLAGLAFLTLPRFSRVPRGLLDREEFPGIWRLVDEVSRELGTSPPDCLAVDGMFNASAGRYGIRQRKILTLGLPLAVSLEDPERIALLAHEMSHFANGDPARGILTGLAMNSIRSWHQVLCPGEILPTSDDIDILKWIGTAAGNMVLFALSLVPRSLLWIMVHLYWSESQAAEYHADRMAFQVSGGAAFAEMLAKLYLHDNFQLFVQRRVQGDAASCLLSEYRRHVLSLPEREMQRIRHLSEKEETRLDSTHPPTKWRRRLALEQAPANPSFRLSGADSKLIDAELERLSGPIERRIVSDYLESIC